MRKTSLLFLVLFVMHNLSAQASETLNNKRFSDLSEGQRHWYFIGAYSAISHMVGMENKEKSACVLNWFFEDTEKKEAKLLENILSYPDHSPTSIIIALLRRSCNVLPKKIGS